MIVEEDLDCIDIADIGTQSWYLEILPRFVFLDEEIGNLVVVNDDGELTRDIDQKKKSDVLQQPIDVYSVTNVVGESIYSVTMWNIYCESVR